MRAKLLLSASPTVAGSGTGSVIVHVAQNQSTVTVYLQSSREQRHGAGHGVGGGVYEWQRQRGVDAVGVVTRSRRNISTTTLSADSLLYVCTASLTSGDVGLLRGRMSCAAASPRSAWRYRARTRRWARW